jgi:GT2 family glycosyltransferase
MRSLKELLVTRSNNYDKFAGLFRKKCGIDIMQGINKKIPLTKSCSIIIPFYKNYLFLKRNLISLLYQNLPSFFKRNKTEIIIINDGSPISLSNLIRRVQKFYPIIYLKLKKNYGRAVARNLGLIYARNEIIVFLDEDIVAPKDFLATHLLRHEFLDKCIIVGFRHNIKLKDLILRMDKFKQKLLRLPSYKRDFRYRKFIPNEWYDTYKDLPPNNFDKTCYSLRESNYFKNFGNGKIIGVWDLPFMFLSCNASVARKYLLEIGGFDTRFRGWGLEDTHLGAKLIARGLYLIPNLHATVYHLITKSSEKEKEQKIKEYKRNYILYNKSKNEPFNLFEGDVWQEKMKKYFKNKFKVTYF